jgi:hypothetical protein
VSEDEYVRTGFESGRSKRDARNDPESPSAITVGMQAVASPRAMSRTARSLTDERRPTFRKLLVEVGIAQSFVVGANTLEQHERPASGEDGERLEDRGIQRLVVRNAGRLMPFENPDGFAEAVSQALMTAG